jgi:hypothetical protein
MSTLDIIGTIVAVIIIAACIAWPRRKDDLDEAIERYLHERKD